MQLTEAQRKDLLDRAIHAVRARRDAAPDTPDAEVRRLGEIAALAVTDAVTRGGHIHTLISHAAGVSGLRVIDLITDPTARGIALGVERNAAKNYTALVRQAMSRHARQQLAEQGHGARAALARQYGVQPRTVDELAAETPPPPGTFTDL